MDLYTYLKALKMGRSGSLFEDLVAIKRKTGSVIKTEFAAIASFITKRAQTAIAVEVQLDPIQDLHGYDKPWSGGAGKNKFPNMTEGSYSGTSLSVNVNEYGTAKVTSTGYGTVLVPLDEPITVQTGQKIIYVGDFAGAVYFLENGTSVDYWTANGSTREITDISSLVGRTIDAVRILVNDAITAKSISIMLVDNSVTDFTYEPYSNICPISGHDEVEVWDDPIYGGTIYWNQLRTSTNVSNTSDGVTTSYDDSTHKITITNNSRTTNYTSGSSQVTLFSGALDPTHKYIVLATTDDAGVALVAQQGGTQKGLLSINAIGTVSGKADGFMLRLKNNYDFVNAHPIGNELSFYLNVCDLTEMFGAGNEPSTVDEFKALFPLDYYAYNSGTTTCVSAVSNLPYEHYTTDLGRTVYGGQLDVVSGELVVTHESVDLGSLGWASSAISQHGNRFYTNDFTDAKPPTDTSVMLGLVCSEYEEKLPSQYNQAVQGITIYTNRTIQIYDASKSSMTASEFKTAMSGVQLCYELATPQTYQLTPTEVSLLLGNNNVWSDGDVSVTYVG